MWPNAPSFNGNNLAKNQTQVRKQEGGKPKNPKTQKRKKKIQNVTYTWKHLHIKPRQTREETAGLNLAARSAAHILDSIAILKVAQYHQFL